jgi:glycosyltransferase involved in cell wall biosynthesis
MISYYLPSGSKIGVGYQVHALANALVQRGHEVTVFSSCGPSEGALYETRTVELTGANRTFRFAIKLRAVAWDEFDVLHAHGDDYWLGWRLKPAHVRTLHGSCLAEARFVTGTRERLRMLLLGLGEVIASVTAQRTIAVSANTYRRLPWVNEVIPNGVDMSRFTPQQRSANPSVLFVGTYGWRKRGRLLADVFEYEIRPVLPNAELWMVCEDGRERPGITVLGRVSDAELADLYGRAWAFCLPSTYEGFGIPYIEAMAAGTPVVATRNPGAVEVTEGGRTGVLAEHQDLGSALVRLLTSPELREDLAARGLRAAARYNLDDVVSEYETVYGELLGAKAGAEAG